MKYKAGTRRRALEYEKAISDFWQKDGTFAKSVDNRDAKNSYVFYDGPPFITGMPHHGTLLSSIVKDAVPRYWTMQGKHVERRWGWDCHGLPAENFVEKQLGITDRREIGTKISLENYIIKARESMVANSETWRSTIDRIGRWVDFDNSYRTMNKDFMESVWWAFKTLYDKGFIYEGRKVLMYDTKFATPVSKAEVTMDNDAYQVVTDPSAYVKFKLKDQNYYLMAWTTTPWTLPANKMLAVSPNLTYGLYQGQFIVAVEVAPKLFADEQPSKTFQGSELNGLEYYDLLGNKKTHKVYTADFVGKEEGTGIVHIAPAYGEDDYNLYLAHEDEAEFEDVLDENGYYLPETAEKLHQLGVRDTDDHGIQIWDGNKFIAKVLEAAGIIYKIEYIKHEYPFNPRSKSRIIYRAFPSWFFDVQTLKPDLIKHNQQINWFPEYIKEGRFKKNIEAAPDWNLSRDRFWATAMPVWKGDKGTVKVVGSYQELKDLSGVELEDYHRPWVDAIEFDLDGEHFKRVDKVLDCWFESGSMPFAQLHYPFENKDKFEQNYPADFIVEYVGQVRAWFYYVHVVNTALFGKNAYKNVIVTGTLAGNDGRKMSKSLGNFTDPNELMDKFSADSLRFLLLSSPVTAGEDFALLDKDVSDVARKLSMIWNVYDFFTTYAEVDGFDSDAAKLPKTFANPLDAWIISRIYELRNEIVAGMEEYNLPKALAGVLPFIDDLSNWFVRRSRRRFWKSEDDADKLEAYNTLYFCLVYFAEIIAPFTPFLTEELYQKMTGSTSSVHLLDYPEAGVIDQTTLDLMARTRAIINEGLMLRMQKSDTEAQIKIRQPLASFTYAGDKLPEFYEQIIKDELNVKKVQHGKTTHLDKTLTKELKDEGFARELIRVIQSARKKAGLQVDDRIKLSTTFEVPEQYLDLIKTETLATEYVKDGNFAYDEITKIENQQGTISLEKYV
ncbi:isoleucine--tRNA ligase [Candidatus Saccharibacteria bacterium]|nr:isoleucine--tRNA ligase [Candidatus Saccharibacteria bacterium]MBR6122861.1 isoleucine--tRNA ligase [Candidatus Saccharibacteria bacterium]